MYLWVNYVNSTSGLGIDSSLIERSNRRKPLMSNRILALTRREEQLALGVQVQILAVLGVGDDDDVGGVEGRVEDGAEDAADGDGAGDDVGGLVGPVGEKGDDEGRANHDGHN